MENGRERQKRVAYERQNEGRRHKSGKRRPRVGWGRGKLSMISMQRVKEEEQSSLEIER